MVTPADIAVALGRTVPPVDSAEYAQWQMWIDDATRMIQWRADELGITEPLDPDKLDLVVRLAVVAHIKHPDSSTQVTVSVDDASTTRGYKSGKGRVDIIDEWWALLGLVGSGAVGSFQMYGEPDGGRDWITTTDWA